MDIEASLFDVAVIGGGLAGAASAIHLARLGRTVILLEQTEYNLPRIGETLSPTIRPILTELGVWDSFLVTGPIPSHGIKSAWGGNNLMSSSFIFSPYGTGWHINRQRFDDMMSKVAANEGAIVLTRSLVTHIVPDPDIEKGWVIKFRSQNLENVKDKRNGEPTIETSFQAKSIINATGRSSTLLQQLRGKQILYDNLVGLAVWFQGIGKPTDSFTLIEASEEGWWYSAPIPRGVWIVVFMTDVDIMVKNRLNQVGEWMKHLNKTEHMKARCSGCRLLTGPKTVSASTRRLVRCVYKDKWLAVGDAALAADPLSANGICFALRSGRNGAHAIDLWLSGNGSAARIYDEQLDEKLNQYLRNRLYYYTLETRWPDSCFWKRRSVINNLGDNY